MHRDPVGGVQPQANVQHEATLARVVVAIFAQRIMSKLAQRAKRVMQRDRDTGVLIQERARLMGILARGDAVKVDYKQVNISIKL